LPFEAARSSMEKTNGSDLNNQNFRSPEAITNSFEYHFENTVSVQTSRNNR
jgi:hypothetical protein